MTDHWALSATERARLVAALSGANQPLAYPPAITQADKGGKFTPEGEVLTHPGNTFICHIDQKSIFYDRLCAAQDGLKTGPWGAYMTFLPKPSFHMTIFCGISGSPLGVDGWPTDINPSATLGEITALFIERLSRFSGPTGYRVRPVGANGPVSIRMQPDDPDQEACLRRMRDALRDITGLHRPNHVTYHFHVSLAYMTCFVSPAQADALLSASEAIFAHHLQDVGPINLGPVEFCHFATMCHFDPLGTLGPEGFRFLP